MTGNKKSHILFHRPTPWDSKINCSTKIFACRFAEAGYPVSYLQSLINPGHLLSKKGYYETWKKGSRLDRGVWVTAGFSLIPDMDRYTTTARLTGRLRYRMCIPGIPTQVRESGNGDPQIIWTTVPGSSALKDLFPGAKLIFHVIDNYAAYRGPGVTVLEAEDYRRADHIFAIGQALHDRLVADFRVDPQKITVLGQGVALEKYTGDFSVPDELAGLPRPLAIWVGLEKKLDFDLLDAAAREIGRAGGSTVLIGPGLEAGTAGGYSGSDVVFLGAREPERIPGFLRASDIGLMLYDRRRDAIYDGQNPLKLYEYAAAGLPTISTAHAEFDTLRPPVLTVATGQDVRAAVRRILADPDRLRTRMLDFAAGYSWDRIMNEAVARIDQLLDDETNA